jgi:CheY-like chemotaxis protein
LSHPLNSTPVNAGLPIFRKKKKGYILLIENKPEIASTVSLLLDSQGYEVITASNVTEAYSLIRYKGFEFILFDWFLEGERGLELCRLIRTINHKIPVFFYTSSSEGGFKQAIESEVEQYSIQSIEANPILKVIFQHIEKKHPMNR